MTEQRAPRCSHDGCSNTTWNPGGRCYRHLGSTGTQVGAGPDSGTLTSAAAAVLSPHADPDTITSAVSRVFPDVEQPVCPASIREQVRVVLESAVSVDVYRGFPHTDATSEQDRNRLLRGYHYELVEGCHVSPVTITDQQASALSASSQDRYGRGLLDSAGLASYGIRKEWELARATGLEMDEDGNSYRVPFDRYCDLVSSSLDQVVSDEFFRQVQRYPGVITLVSGRRPLCAVPVIAPQPVSAPHPSSSPTRSRTAVMDHPIPRQDEPAVAPVQTGAERHVEQVSVGGLLRDALFPSRETRRRIREERLEERRQQDQDELVRLQLAELRRRRGPFGRRG